MVSCAANYAAPSTRRLCHLAQQPVATPYLYACVRRTFYLHTLYMSHAASVLAQGQAHWTAPRRVAFTPAKKLPAACSACSVMCVPRHGRPTLQRQLTGVHLPSGSCEEQSLARVHDLLAKPRYGTHARGAHFCTLPESTLSTSFSYVNPDLQSTRGDSLQAHNSSCVSANPLLLRTGRCTCFNLSCYCAVGRCACTVG